MKSASAIAVSTLVSLFLVVLVARWPVDAMAIGVASSLAMLLLGGGLLTAGARLHLRASRQTHQTGVKAGVLARDHGRAFLLWFFGHALVWAGGLTLCTCAALRVFGPRGGVLVLAAGCLAAALFSLSGLVGRGSPALLGLCWQQHVPLAGTPLLVYPETAVALWPRFGSALDLDLSSARKRGGMSVFTRIQISLDLTRTERSAPRFDLGKPLREAALHEIVVRARALALMAWPAMVLALLLALAGGLKTPASFDPENWMSAAQTPTSEISAEKEQEKKAEQEKTPGEEQGKAREEAGDGGDSAADDSGDGKSPSKASSNQTSQQGESQQGEGQQDQPNEGTGDQQSQPDGSEDGQQGRSGEGEGHQGEGEGEGDTPSTSPGEDAGRGSGEDSGNKDDDGSGDSSSGDSSNGDSSSGDSSSDDSNSDGSGGTGEGAGQWGLGNAPPEGTGSIVKLPTGGQILTLEMAQIGGQSVRLEQSETPPSDVEASRGGSAGRRQPSRLPTPRESTAPKSAQQPLPAWIVRLLGGKSKDDS